VTPHAGEFKRIEEAVKRDGPEMIVTLKGVVTKIWGKPAGGSETRPTYHSFFGGPVLARGGSGDVLCGLIGGLLAQAPKEPLIAAARGVVWHGMAADLLARTHGQTAVQVTQLLDFLPEVLRER
jgi:NAD(P)H-hydrate epimerase